jgi:hypothetical protein
MLKKINCNGEIRKNIKQVKIKEFKVNQKKFILTNLILNDMIYMLQV